MPQQVIVIPFSGQLIGQGYNSDTGENVGTALEVDSIFEDSSADAQDAATAFESVATQDSLKEALGFSSSLDVRVGLFSGAAKVNFSQDHGVNSSSTYIAGRSFVQNAIRHGKGFRLTPEAKALLAAGNMDDFKKAFGDRFVRSLNTGGEFCIVARVTSVSEEHQSKLAAALHLEYQGLVASGQFDAALNTANSETHNQTEVSVKMLQSGGQGDELSFTGPDATKIIERFQALPRFVHEHASGLQAELATYDTIPIPIPTAEEREDRTIVLNDCATQKNEFLAAKSELQLTLEPGAELMFDNLPLPDERKRMLGQYRDALTGLMAHAIGVSTGRIDPPQLFRANPAPPAINFTKKPFSNNVAMPSVIGKMARGDQSGPGAQEELEALRLIVNFVAVPTSLGNEAEIVLTQSPTANTSVPRGSNVTIGVGDFNG
jgi:hypothetical protein